MVCRMPFPDALRGSDVFKRRVVYYLVTDIVKSTFLAFDSISFMIAVGVGLLMYLVLIRR